MTDGELRAELLKAALERRTVTYGYLMQKFNVSRGSQAGKTVVSLLDEIDKVEHAKAAPGFAALVVRKDTGFPGGGFFCWEGIPANLRRPWEKSQDPKLSESERKYIIAEQEHIWAYYAEHHEKIQP
jgi:hypothetical protein